MSWVETVTIAAVISDVDQIVWIENGSRGAWTLIIERYFKYRATSETWT